MGGASDPYLSIANAIVNNLGSFSLSANLVGDLPADGVGGYSFWLQDIGADDNHEIHVGIGNNTVNFWLSIPGFNPPDGSWQQFSVDITDPSQWVQIIGTGTFQDALATSDRLLFRHDLPPFGADPQRDRRRIRPGSDPRGGGLRQRPGALGFGRALLAVLLVAFVGFALHRRHARHLRAS